MTNSTTPARRLPYLALLAAAGLVAGTSAATADSTVHSSPTLLTAAIQSVSLSGVVKDHKGDPKADVQVILTPFGMGAEEVGDRLGGAGPRKGGGLTSPSNLTQDSQSKKKYKATTDKNGKFKIDGIEPGVYQYEIGKRTEGSASGVVNLRKAKDDLEVKLRPPMGRKKSDSKEDDNGGRGGRGR